MKEIKMKQYHLEMWGIRKVYKLRLVVQAVKPDEIPNRIMQKINKALNG